MAATSSIGLGVVGLVAGIERTSPAGPEIGQDRADRLALVATHAGRSDFQAMGPGTTASWTGEMSRPPDTCLERAQQRRVAARHVAIVNGQAYCLFSTHAPG